MSYVIQGVTYHPSFPLEWAMSHRPGTGPVDCANCAYYGMQGELFKGYCLNCYHYVYLQTRVWFNMDHATG